MNSKIFLAPHNDDETLFGAYIIMKEKPFVVICTDSHSKEKNIIVTRRNESREAMDILGAEVWFLGIPNFADAKMFRAMLEIRLSRLDNVETVYAPNIDSSNIHHKVLGEVAKELFDNVIFYDTYKDSYGTTGIGKKVKHTAKMKLLKTKAMLKYKSQIEKEITKKYFSEVWDEYTCR